MIDGWDNAPLVDVQLTDHPKPVTFIYPYYRNAGFFAQQLQWWHWYPDETKRHISAIIVDDGSPEDDSAEAILKGASLPFSIRLFKIEVDVRFNWLAARNIAMKYANGDWCMGTDMDHVVPPETARSLIWGDHNPKYIYRFSRAEHSGEIVHPHPNSWFMTKEMYWKFGGYDEALSGFYGTDGDARRRWAKTAKAKTLKERLIRFEFVGDSSTKNYLRKQPEDQAVAKIVKARKPDWKPKVLSFPFHEVSLDA